MPTPRVQHYLDKHQVHMCIISHPEAFTATQTAAAAHVPGRELAKTVVVQLDGRLALIVVPSCCQLDMERVCRATGASHARLATEMEFRFAFPDCDLGAMPALGNLYGLEVYVSQELGQSEHIAFNGGSHKQLVRMPYTEFVGLVQPTVVDVACLPEMMATAPPAREAMVAQA